MTRPSRMQGHQGYFSHIHTVIATDHNDDHRENRELRLMVKSVRENEHPLFSAGVSLIF